MPTTEKTKRSTRIADWREDENVVNLRPKLTKFAREALVNYDAVKTDLMAVQKDRVANNTIAYRDISSKGMQKLVESIARDKAYRSSIVYKMLSVHDSQAFMKDALSLLRRKLRTNYSAALKKEFGAITNQNEGIEDYFSRAMQAVKAGDLLVKLADIIIADIDSSAFSDQRLTKTAELIFHPGRAD